MFFVLPQGQRTQQVMPCIALYGENHQTKRTSLITLIEISDLSPGRRSVTMTQTVHWDWDQLRSNQMNKCNIPFQAFLP